MMEYKYDFVITTPFEIEESLPHRAVLTGIFLKLGNITRNGREYLVEEGQSIANKLNGMPVRFGNDPITNKHLKGDNHIIGRVIQTIFDKIANLIKGKVEIWNTPTYPNLVQKVKKGFGLSVGGKALDLVPTGGLNSLGRAVMKVIGMLPNHLQLMLPEKYRGQEEAQVHDVEPIEESLSFDPCPEGLCDLSFEKPVEESGESSDTTDVEPVIPEPTTGDPVIDPEPSMDVPLKTRKIYIVSDPDSTLRRVGN